MINLIQSRLLTYIEPAVKGILKIDLKAGETKNVTFNSKKNALPFAYAQLEAVTKSGGFKIRPGIRSAKFNYNLNRRGFMHSIGQQFLIVKDKKTYQGINDQR